MYCIVLVREPESQHTWWTLECPRSNIYNANQTVFSQDFMHSDNAERIYDHQYSVYYCLSTSDQFDHLGQFYPGTDRIDNVDRRLYQSIR